jgi:hypothetical protein
MGETAGDGANDRALLKNGAKRRAKMHCNLGSPAAGEHGFQDDTSAALGSSFEFTADSHSAPVQP